MNGRELAEEIIYERTRLLDAARLRLLADALPVGPLEAVDDFGWIFGFSPSEKQLIADNDVSIPYQLYGIADAREQVEKESTKEVIVTSETK